MKAHNRIPILLVAKKFGVQTNFGCNKILGPKKFWVQNILDTIFGAKKYLDAKNFGCKKLSGPNKFWVQKHIGIKNSWYRKIFCPKNVDSKGYWSKKISDQKMICVKKNFI